VWKVAAPKDAAPYTHFHPPEAPLAVEADAQLPNKLNGSILNKCSEFVCFRLQFEKALDVAAERGFNREEIQRLPDLHFVSKTDVGRS